MNSNRMKAVVCTKYGSPEVLQIKEIPKPIPKVNELSIKNFVTAVTGSDVLIRGADMPVLLGLMFRMMIGFRKPRMHACTGTCFCRRN